MPPLDPLHSGGRAVEGDRRIWALESNIPAPLLHGELGKKRNQTTLGDHLSDLSFHFIALALTESH